MASQKILETVYVSSLKDFIYWHIATGEEKENIYRQYENVYQFYHFYIGRNGYIYGILSRSLSDAVYAYRIR